VHILLNSQFSKLGNNIYVKYIHTLLFYFMITDELVPEHFVQSMRLQPCVLKIRVYVFIEKK
jgi:hypothetical protein